MSTPSISIDYIVVQCTEVLSAPENGNVIVAGDTYLSEAEYSCMEGFAVVGLAIRICQADGEWSSTEPHCEGTNKINLLHVPFVLFLLICTCREHVS